MTPPDQRIRAHVSVAATASLSSAVASRLAVGLVVAVGVVVAACGTSEPKPTFAHAPETWCPDGFEQGPDDTCFAIPDTHDKETPVLVYLHGMFEGHGSPAEWSAVREATQRGFAVVVPRGRRGLCAWKPELRDHFCWPQDGEDVPTMRTMIAGWEKVFWQVDTLLGRGTHRRYLLGFSNGGYFASFMTTHGLFTPAATAVVDGGSLGPPNKTPPVPLMLVAEESDARGEAAGAGPSAGKMKSLDAELSRTGWNHVLCQRRAATTIAPDDVRAALGFFKHEADGSLRATPPVSWSCDPLKPSP